VDDKAKKVRVKVKTPGGEHTIFLNVTHTVRQLFMHLRTYVASLLRCFSICPWYYSISHQTERYGFTLQQAMPKKVVWEETDLTIEVAGLANQAVALVPQ
jgi:hypothetical protein